MIRSSFTERNLHLLFPLPALAFVALLMVFPVLYTGYLSFTNWNLTSGGDPSFVGVRSYARVVTEPRFLHALGRTFLFTGFAVVVETVNSQREQMQQGGATLTPEERMEVVRRTRRFLGPAVPLMAGIVAYSTSEAVVRAQAEELVALSLRVLPLYPGIVVLPLLGEIAAERAGQLTQVLLAAVARHACRFALIDLSGVPAFDAEAAALLVRAAQAVELLGATPVLVGIRPAAAQAMVERNLVLARLTTLADLESGLRHALGRLGVTFTQAGPR